MAVGAGALWLGGPLAGLATEASAAQGKAGTEGDTRQITVSQVTNASAALSPDGRHLVYQSYADGNFHLWLARADGTEGAQV